MRTRVAWLKVKVEMSGAQSGERDYASNELLGLDGFALGCAGVGIEEERAESRECMSGEAHLVRYSMSGVSPLVDHISDLELRTLPSIESSLRRISY